MAFDNVPFPLPLTALRARPRWSDTVVELGGGSEQRTSWWSDYRRVYNALTGIRSLADWMLIERHFNARRARVRTFPLLDLTNYKIVVPQPIGTGTGSSATYQTIHQEGDSGNSYERPIRKPVPGTVVVYDGATLISFSMEYTTGVVTCTAGNGHVVSMTCQYYTVVRYDFSEMPPPELFVFRQDGTGLINGPDLPMIETRDYL